MLQEYTELPARWLAELTPERLRVAAQLVESLRFETTVEDDAARTAFDVDPRGLREAIAAAVGAPAAA